MTPSQTSEDRSQKEVRRKKSEVRVCADPAFLVLSSDLPPTFVFRLLTSTSSKSEVVRG
jgi:hypothetical protein